MTSPRKLSQRPSRAERALNRGSAYSSGSETSADGSRLMDNDMAPPAKRPRQQRDGGWLAEHEMAAASIHQPSGNPIKRALPSKKTYGKAAKSQAVESATPRLMKGMDSVPLDEIFATTKNQSSLPRRKPFTSDFTSEPIPATLANTENTPLSSPLTSPPSTQASRSSPLALAEHPPPPLIVVYPAAPPLQVALPSPTSSVPQEVVAEPVVAQLAPPSYATRSEWSRRKVEGRPGLRIIGKVPAVMTRKKKSVEKAGGGSAAQKQEKEEALVQLAEPFVRISLTVIIHDDPFATIAVSHSSSRFPIHPNRADRTPTRTSLLYAFNHTGSSILNIKLSSNVIAVPDEICAPFLDEEQARRSEWALEVWNGKAEWKV
ncbi:hypothetical protein BCR35DRAFT_332762 [Leucosporidium creatinivorum]|uniref:Uncharacterized protein n=1 Tax=Leucosporidium creatinivorum TaxID=106004 RepID=A0A1Y2EY39_9BASI|nr:hypothetical protein BCR35DRAFT_332762 [Leucosporidium creatinivorum]